MNKLAAPAVKHWVTTKMNPTPPRRAGGTADAIDRAMTVALQARVRRILSREFYRRGGRLTWDMKMALRRVLAKR